VPDLLDPLRRQVDLLQQLVDRQQKLQRDIAGHLLAPGDALFDLLEESGAMVARQAEALEAAGAALAETAALMRRQAELFERSVGALRKPMELAKSAAGVEPRRRKKRT
jgi:hypothetical protein